MEQTRQLPAHELIMSELMMPDTANFSGNVHGGELLRLLDQVAYSCASRYSGNYCVTLSVDKVLFKEPIHVGDLVTFYASVNYTGRTSMESASASKRKTSAPAKCAIPIAATSPWSRSKTANPFPSRRWKSPPIANAAAMKKPKNARP